MMPEAAPTQVNQHYLDRLITIADSHPVEANEDVYSNSGIKLVAKGARINRDVQDRLIMHKLRRPLEVSLNVADAITPATLAETANRIVGETPGLHPLIGISGLDQWIRNIQLNDATSGLLAVASRQKTDGIHHNLRVALVALSIGAQLKLVEHDMHALTMAGLLHDIGELYIAPEHLNNAMTPESWRHVSAHPLIGYKIATDICGIHPNAARAILEHHELGDGSGYPRGTRAQDLSRLGQILGVADLVTTYATNSASHPLAHADLALRLSPREFPRDIADVINRSISKREGLPPPSSHSDAQMHALFMHIARTVEMLEFFQESILNRPEEEKLLNRITDRFQLIQRAFSSSGLDICNTDASFQQLVSGAPEWLRFETELILDEIRRRLRDLARDLTLRSGLLSDASAAFFRPLVITLQGDD